MPYLFLDLSQLRVKPNSESAHDRNFKNILERDSQVDRPAIVNRAEAKEC